MAYYECSSKEEPESIIITLVPDTNVESSGVGRLTNIYFYIDNALIANYGSGSRYFWTNKSYTYTSPKSNKSVNINTIANIIDGNGNGYYVPTSVQLGINGIVVSTLGAGDSYFIHGAIVYKHTFS